jgi:hypothetical protein
MDDNIELIEVYFDVSNNISVEQMQMFLAEIDIILSLENKE